MIVLKKENLLNCELCRPGGPLSDKKKRKEVQILACSRKLKKKKITMGVMVIPMVDGELLAIPKSLDNGIGSIRNRRTSRDHPNYGTVKVLQNAVKSF